MLNALRNWLRRSWESPSVPITSDAIRSVIAANDSASGVAVDRHSVFGLPSFYRGVDLIASTVGRVPLYTYRRTPQGGRERDNSHPAYKLLTRRPNSWQTAFEFKRDLTSNAVVAGNGYSYVARNAQGVPTDLVILDSDRTYPVVVTDSKHLERSGIYYVTTIDGDQIILQADEMIHIKGLTSASSCCGMRLTDALKDSLGLGLSVIRHGATYFRHNCTPSLVVEFPEFMRNKEQIEQFREAFQGRHQGAGNNGKLAILQGGAKLAKAQTTMEEAQWIESRKATSVDVALMLGLPPHKLGVAIGTSYNSLEQENLAILSDCYDKWFINLEEQFEQKLLTEASKNNDSHFIEFDRSRLQAADHASTVKVFIDLVNNGLILPSHAALELNLPPVPPEADGWRLPNTILQPVPEQEEPSGPQDGEPAQDVAPDEEPPQDAQEPPQDSPEDTVGRSAVVRLRNVARSILVRFLDRLRRSAEAAGRRGELRAWDYGDHLDTLTDFLAPLTDDAERQAESFLVGIGEELKEVTREDIPAVFARVDVDKWAGRLIDG